MAFKLSLSGAQITHLLQDRSVERLATGVNMLLVALIAVAVARLTWNLLPMPDSPPPPTAALAPQEGSVPGADDARALAELHLFGEAQVVAPEPVVTSAPDTQLNLFLRGLVSSDDERGARAIIAAPDNTELPYAIGDPLPGDATLKQIRTDRVILLRNGRYETLRLPRETSGATMDDDSPDSVSFDSGADLRTYREMVLQDPSALNNLMRLIPLTEGGRFKGYRLIPGRDARVLARFGLQPGDVVTNVNGIQLDTPSKGAEALQSLATSDVVSVTIMRNGMPQSLTLRMDE